MKYRLQIFLFYALMALRSLWKPEDGQEMIDMVKAELERRQLKELTERIFSQTRRVRYRQ